MTARVRWTVHCPICKRPFTHADARKADAALADHQATHAPQVTR